MRHYYNKVPHSIIFATSVEDLYKPHKNNFDGVNVGAGTVRHTSLDWFLAPSERPSIDEAQVKEHYIDIPGSNGGLDLTESLTGFPLYNYIESSFEFIIFNDRFLPSVDSNGVKIGETEVSWEILNRDIRDFLNGKKLYMLLEDDPSWYYYGRFTVGKYDSSDHYHSAIKIFYKLYPYKKLSKYAPVTKIDNNTTFIDNNFNSYFDALSLTSNELNPIYKIFWNMKNIELIPEFFINPEFDGSIEGKLPCGREPVSVEFTVYKETNAYNPKIYFTGPNGDITTNIFTEQGENPKSTKVRGVNLSNILDKNKSILYSDNTLRLSLHFPTAYDTSTSGYKKGDYIKYTSTQSAVTWVLKANEDIAKDSTFDLSKWDVDEGAINATSYLSSKSYETNDNVYVKNENSIILYTAIAEVPINTDPVNDTEHDYWSNTVDPVTLLNLYKTVKVTMDYDIGVM